jgi:5-methylthioadenosine/S-adenosylhomocysteine deaminase
MLETLKFAACLQKVGTLDAMALLPEEVLWMATMGGARAMGLEHTIGSLEVGKKADVVLVDLNSPHIMPVHRVPSALVYNANGGDVDTVIVDGLTLLERGQLLGVDVERLRAGAQQFNRKLYARTAETIYKGQPLTEFYQPAFPDWEEGA